MNNLGKILKHIRVFNHYKQVELAKKLDISRSYISQLETGVKTPSQEILNKYSEFSRLPVYTIMLFAENFNNLPPLKRSARQLMTSATINFLDWICRDEERIKTKG